MKSKFMTTAFVLAAVLVTCCSFNLEARSRARFGFSFGSGYSTPAPVYVAPRVQPVYVYPSCPTCYPVVYDVPVYRAAPVVYETPVYVYPQAYRSSGFSFSFGNFWR